MLTIVRNLKNSVGSSGSDNNSKPLITRQAVRLKKQNYFQCSVLLRWSLHYVQLIILAVQERLVPAVYDEYNQLDAALYRDYLRLVPGLIGDYVPLVPDTNGYYVPLVPGTNGDYVPLVPGTNVYYVLLVPAVYDYVTELRRTTDQHPLSFPEWLRSTGLISITFGRTGLC